MATTIDVSFSPAHAPQAPPTLKSLLESYERQLILSALACSGGRQRQAASALGILPTTLHEKMTRLGIPTARARNWNT
jgi:DNA-binding NtrC family response regulator